MKTSQKIEQCVHLLFTYVLYMGKKVDPHTVVNVFICTSHHTELVEKNTQYLSKCEISRIGSMSVLCFFFSLAVANIKVYCDRPNRDRLLEGTTG